MTALAPRIIRSSLSRTNIFASTRTQLRNAALAPLHLQAQTAIKHNSFHTTTTLAMPAEVYDKPVATIDASLVPRLPAQSISLFEAKKAKRLTFEEIGKFLGREEVAVASIFYGQSQASEEDVTKLAELLSLDEAALKLQMYGLPDRGRALEMPPKEPLIYRLYEVVQNYGLSYRAVINEKFGDGIMSAICFSTKVEKEQDDQGTWVKITMRGKWLPYTRF